MALSSPALDPHTRFMIVDEGLELLDEDEARELLRLGEVGRVGITIGALPAIFPVNYRVIDGAIVFRTSPGSKMSAAAAGAVVAFEVDDYQLADRSGWSVLVVGNAQPLDEESLLMLDVGQSPQPWPEGRHVLVVQLQLTMMTGRRVHPS